MPLARPLTSESPAKRSRSGLRRAEQRGLFLIDQVGIGDQFGQDHRHGLQRLDLDLLVAAGIDVLDAEHADRALAPDNRHPGERVEFFLAGFGAIGEVRVRGRLGEVERLDILGDRPDQPFADRHPGDVDRLLRQPAGGEQFEHAFAQQVDRADLAIEPFANHPDHVVELGLGIAARSHHIVEPGQDRAGGAGSMVMPPA